MKTPGDAARDELGPYRNWALQNNVISILGGGAEWGRADAVAESPTAPGSGGLSRGNAALAGELEPDPEYGLRIRSIVWMFVAVLASGAVNQLTPFGVKVSTESYLLTTGMAASALAVCALVLPRLAPRPFMVVGQLILVYTYALIVIKCQATGGAGSPYALWWVFVTLYTAYFLERRRAIANIAGVSVAMILPAVVEAGDVTYDTAIFLAVLLAVNWVLAFTVLSGSELARRAERAVRYLALADPLTGVANLRAFESTVERMIRSGESQFALIVVDMNGLKGANAAFGFETGDDMLRRLGRLLCENCDDRAQVARIRGDEFAVALPDIGATGANEWLAGLHAAIDQHNESVRKRAPRLSIEAGYACYPQDATRTAKLFQIADRRMFEAKRQEVQQPYEVDAPATPATGHLLRPTIEIFNPRKRHMLKAPMHSGLRWLLAAAMLAAYAAGPGLTSREQALALGLAGFSLAFGLFGMLAQRGFRPVLFLRLSDLFTLLVIAPSIWVSGGWSSPLQAATIFPVAFYAQFMVGRMAVTRVIAALSLYVMAFWLSDAVGASAGPPSELARTLFVTVVTSLVVIAVIVQHNRRAADRAVDTIRRSASHDPLTGVGNVYAFREELVRMIRAAEYEPQSPPRGAPQSVMGRDSLPAVVIADVDDFRGVNNRSGHLVGDSVLKSVAERLRKNVGEDGAVYRIDCDEFAVLYKIGQEGEVDAMRERLSVALGRPQPYGGELPEHVTLSVGGAVWRAGATPSELVETAEAALEHERERRRAGAPRRGGATLL